MGGVTRQDIRTNTLMGLGTAIFILGMCFLMIRYPEFRKVVIWTTIAAVVVVIILLNSH
jgi:hypothetical protein